MRIVIADPHNADIEHSPFNAAVVDIVATAFPNAGIEFWGSKPQIEAVSALAESTPRWVPQKVETILEGGAYGRLAYDTAWAFKVRASRPELFVDLTAASTRVIALTQVASSKTALQFFWHSWLNKILDPRPRYDIIKRSLDVWSAFRCQSQHRAQSFVLEQYIFQNMVHKLPAASGCLAVLPHPIPRAQPLDAPDTLSIGFLGACTREKGFNSFIELAEYSLSTGAVATFHAIGTSIGCASSRFLTTQPSQSGLTRSTFLEGAAKVRYVFLALDAGHYSFAASATLLDCISFGRPILALATPPMRRFFDLYPDVGFIEETIPLLLQRAQAASNSEYASQVAAMRRYASDRTAAALAVDYRRHTLQAFPRLRGVTM